MTAPSCFFWNVSYACGAAVERQPVGGEVVDAQRVVVGEQRQDVGRPSACTLAWPIRSWICLSNSGQHRHRVGHAAVHADQRDRAAAPDDVDRGVERGEPVDARRLHQLRGHRVGQQPGDLVRELRRPASRAPPCPTASITASGPRPPVSSRTTSPRSSSCSAQVERLDAVRRARAPGARAPGRRRSPARRRGAARSARPCRRSARARARPAVPPSGTPAYSHRLPRGGQHVGEVDEPVVRRPVGHLDRRVLRLRHPQVLGLSAGHLRRRAWCSRTARRPCPARAPGWSRTGCAGPGRT